jgi:hypothetical protein
MKFKIQKERVAKQIAVFHIEASTLEEACV